ncbi:MAG: arginine-tRNA-protein transferase [Bacteroidia bacterium]|nr:arginine-tRNA-protein transferase [Bacteroidia bacterium]
MNQKSTSTIISMSGHLFDYYLDLGYYRMRQNLFTTDEYFDIDKCCMYDTFWLRTKVMEVAKPSTHKIWKLNKKFSVTISKAKFNEEINQLYEGYRNQMNFDAHESIQHFMLDGEKHCEFNSFIIEIRDQNKLIAAGYFDLGANSMAGNLNFYDPSYKKYSLGKYLMLRKIDFAQTYQLHYYYTGYLAVANTKFDYKLFPDAEAVEVLIKQENNQWFPYNSIKKEGLFPYAHWANAHKNLNIKPLE